MVLSIPSILEQLRAWPWTTALAVLIGVSALRTWAESCRRRQVLCLALGGKEAMKLAGKLPVVGRTHFFAKHEHMLNDWIAVQCLALGGDGGRVQDPDEEEEEDAFDNFPEGDFQTGALKDLFGDGMIAVDGDKWYTQRKIARHLVTMRTLRDSMTEIVQNHVHTLLHILDDVTSTEDSMLDLVRLFGEFTMETFAEMAFGIQMGSLGSETEHPFHTSMDAISPLLLLRFRLPAWFWKAQRWLGIGTEGAIARNLRTVNDTLLDVVAKSLAGRINGHKDQTETTDIISLFLDHGDDGKLSPQMLRDIVMVFLVAERDTSADTFSCSCYMLQQHPSVEVKIRDELTSKIPAHSERLSMDHFGQLVYLKAAIRETLRLYPSAAFNTREAKVDTVLSDGTFVRTGTSVYLAMLLDARQVYGVKTWPTSDRNAGLMPRRVVSSPCSRSSSWHSILGHARVWAPTSQCWRRDL